MNKRGLMLNRNRKAQFSLEFLLTYGWAIFVVLGVIAAFSFVGVLYPEQYVTNRCILQPPFFCEDFSVDTLTGDVTLRVRNGLNERVKITEVELVDPTAECYFLILKGSGEEELTPGETRDFTVDCNIDRSGKIVGEIKMRYFESDNPAGLEKPISGELVIKVSPR